MRNFKGSRFGLYKDLLKSSKYFKLVCGAGNEDQKKEYLTKIASGDITLAFALEESSRHSPTNFETTAKKDGDSYIINGQKTFVVWNN